MQTSVTTTNPQAMPTLFTGQTATALNPQDIVLPTIAIRQNSFKKVEMKKFTAGQALKLPSYTVMCDEEKTMTFVPLACEKLYRKMIISGGEAKTIGYEPYKTDLPWEFEENGQPMRRDQCFVVYVLPKDELKNQTTLHERLKKGEMVDPEDLVLPVRIVFSRASFQAGKILNTHFELSKSLNNQTPAFIMFDLKTVENKNDKGIWYSFDVSKSKKDKYTPKELLPIADFWVQTLRAAKFKAVDAEDDIEVVETTTSTTTKVTADDKF